MNKTIIIVTSIIAFVFAIVSYWYISYIKAIRLEIRPMDRFTTCIDTVMTKSKENGKPISASEAKDICVQVEKV